MAENAEKPVETEVNNIQYDFATTDKQEARCFLRERFLRVITGIVGKQAEFHLHENTRVTAEFRGCDIDCLDIFVRKLETPIGTMPEAILRSTDVLGFEVKGVKVDQ